MISGSLRKLDFSFKVVSITGCFQVFPILGDGICNISVDFSPIEAFSFAFEGVLIVFKNELLLLISDFGLSGAF